MDSDDREGQNELNARFRIAAAELKNFYCEILEKIEEISKSDHEAQQASPPAEKQHRLTRCEWNFVS